MSHPLGTRRYTDTIDIFRSFVSTVRNMLGHSDYLNGKCLIRWSEPNTSKINEGILIDVLLQGVLVDVKSEDGKLMVFLPFTQSFQIIKK